MRYGSICSGVAPQTESWDAMGAHAAWFSEIESFPSAVLKYRFPDVPNLGDFTKIGVENSGAIELLVGGTPCQDFSVAGLRAGMAGDRGNLTLEFLKLADRLRPRWLVWENVPGVLSSNGGRDFGAFLGGLGQLGYGFAYRVLDAQFFGVPQRRRRVFVVGHLGDWRLAAAVLFERHSLSGNPPPSREAGKRVAPCLEGRAGRSGATNFHTSGGLIEGGAGGVRAESRCGDAGYESGIESGGTYDIAPALTGSGRGVARTGESRGQDCVVAHSLRGEGFDASEDGTGRGIPLVASSGQANAEIAVDQCPTLNCLHEAPIVAFSAKDHGADASPILMRQREGCDGGGKGPLLSPDQSLTLAANCNDQVLFAPATHVLTLGHSQSNGLGISETDTANTLEAVSSANQAVAFAENQRGELRTSDIAPQLSCAGGKPGSGYPATLRGMAVRRLTPRECERLQGAKDDFTLVPYRGKPAADGPRYKAIGNSWAVPVLDWIMGRILEVEKLKGEVK